MQSIKTIKKHVTTDGTEFFSLDSAVEHQKQIELIGKSINVGDMVSFLSRSFHTYSKINVVVTRIDLPLLFTGDEYESPVHIQDVFIYDVKRPENENLNT